MNGQTVKFYLNPACFGGDIKVIETHINGDEISIDLFPSILRNGVDPQLFPKIAEVLGVSVSDIDGVAFSTNVRDYVVGIKNPDALLKMKPDFAAMKQMAETGPYKHEGLIVSSLAPPEADCDLFVRVFLPITGVNEDIACGSGNCSIIPYWYDKGLNRNTGYYKTIFPYPEGQSGFVGGVQKICYRPELKSIVIRSKVSWVS